MFTLRTAPTPYSGRVERLGAIQVGSGDTGRTCYVLLLSGHAKALLLDTQKLTSTSKPAEAFEILKLIALTVLNDVITFELEGDYVVAYTNETLMQRLVATSVT
jgi:hypothetical protein